MRLALFALAGLVLAGCAASPVGPDGADLTLDASASGRPVRLTTGQRLTVTLAANPTTGYSWAVADSVGGALERVGPGVYTQDAAEPGMTGVGGREAWTFRAARPGAGTLRLVYRRPWETGAAPAETFSAPVTVE